MNTNRKRITGCLEQTPRGLVVITEAGDHWVLEDCDGDSELLGANVIAEGVVTGYDRLRAVWIGAAGA